MKKTRILSLAILSMALMTLHACDEDDSKLEVHDVNTAEKATIDRFSVNAGHLMVRDATNGLPAANTPINFDQEPFITKGLGPVGQIVEYYNFDIQPVDPAPIYVLFREGETTPVSGQLNIIDVIPGESTYNDFWLVNKVTVPANYKANEIASFSEIQTKGYELEPTNMIVNCPVVPDGSTATKRFDGGTAELISGWYKEKIVKYFTFDEKALQSSGGDVATSPIYVCFNIDADEDGGGPASGFKVEPSTTQTHNVVATVPASGTYSPLWLVNAYSNSAFENVSDLSTAEAATGMSLGATVNCPVVSVQQ